MSNSSTDVYYEPRQNEHFVSGLVVRQDEDGRNIPHFTVSDSVISIPMAYEEYYAEIKAYARTKGLI